MIHQPLSGVDVTRCAETPWGIRFPVRRSGSWKNVRDDGRTHWIWFVTITGLNGTGGYWIDEELCWSSGGTHHHQPRTLTPVQSRELDAAYARFIAREPLPDPDAPALTHDVADGETE